MAGGILSFGWPCQPVSTAGKRKATEDERWLFDIIADGISILCPGMLFAENVEGLLSAKMPDGSSVFGHCIERLESLHYKVAAGIFSASEVGAVHQRKRVFIMAYRNEPRWEARWHNAISSQGRQPHELAPCGCDQGRAEELAHSSNEGLQGGKWFWQARAQGSPNRHATECSSSMAYSNSGGVSGSRNELGNFGEVGQGWSNPSQNGIIGNVWPSRPGQPQYAWEPPRVVGNATSKRSCGGSEDGANQQPEMLGTGHEAMGNSELFKLQHGGIHKGGQDCWKTNGLEEKREYIVSEIEPKMGRNIDGHTYGVDISKLSSLSDSELAEIYEWMVKGDNRTDELRSCGNGVCPPTATKAFITLYNELLKNE